MFVSVAEFGLRLGLIIISYLVTILYTRDLTHHYGLEATKVYQKNKAVIQ